MMNAAQDPTPSPQASPEFSAIRSAGAYGISPDCLAVALLEASDDCIKLISLTGELEHINCGGMVALELNAASQVLGRLWWDLWPENNRYLVRTEFHRASAGQHRQFEAACPTARGSPRLWRVDLKPLIACGQRVVSVLCTSRDITALGGR